VNGGSTLRNSQFINNSATLSGGEQTGMGFGGALYLSTANYGSRVSNTLFQGNIAQTNGEYMFFWGFCYAQLRFFFAGGSVFIASSNGFGIFARNNEIVYDNCEFYSNQAQTGGALYAFFENYIIFNVARFIGNQAKLDGKI